MRANREKRITLVGRYRSKYRAVSFAKSQASGLCDEKPRFGRVFHLWSLTHNPFFYARFLSQNGFNRPLDKMD
jgi:hypothetical protein